MSTAPNFSRQVRHPLLDLAGAHAWRTRRRGRATITDIIISHAHFDHMGSIAEFPERADLSCRSSELLSWHEAMALPPQFGFLTAIIDPDNLRTALRCLDRAPR